MRFKKSVRSHGQFFHAKIRDLAVRFAVAVRSGRQIGRRPSDWPREFAVTIRGSMSFNLGQLKWFGGLQSNLKPFAASKMLKRCQDQQGIPKNCMLGTKNIKNRHLGPELAHNQYPVGKRAIIC